MTQHYRNNQDKIKHTNDELSLETENNYQDKKSMDSIFQPQDTISSHTSS